MARDMHTSYVAQAFHSADQLELESSEKNSIPSLFFSTVAIDLERPTDFHQNEEKNMD